MKRIGKLFSICLSFVLCAVFMTACGNEKQAEKTAYEIQIKTEGGRCLSDVRVTVYQDETQDQLVWSAETDKDGKISFEALESEKYVAVLDEVPAGYVLEESYEVTVSSEIILSSELLDAANLEGVTYDLGDVIHDFAVTAIDGIEYQLSELLASKKAVILNFWFMECHPCKLEFPYMQEAYDDYEDVLEVIAINPLDGTNDSISQYGKDLSLTFPMVVGEQNWIECFELNAYPTTVVIDRYGTICMIHKGSVTDKETFVKVFEYVTSDEYVQTTIKNISAIE